MAYGVDAEVELMVGGLTEFITSARITTAIEMADREVDLINSSATAEAKTSASNDIAARYLLWGSNNSYLEGLQSQGSTEGSPTRSAPSIPDMSKFVTDKTRDKLINSNSGSSSIAVFQSEELT